MTDNNTAGDNNSLLGTLHALTGLRTDLLRGLESGLRNDASDDSIAMRQKVGILTSILSPHKRYS